MKPSCLPHRLTDIDNVARSLREHVAALTVSIGERSPRRPKNLDAAAAYIHAALEGFGLDVTSEAYRYKNHTVSNVFSEIKYLATSSRRYLLGAHYDTVPGTVGADDNASGVAVLLETARGLKRIGANRPMDTLVRCVAFTLEERPAFWTPQRGSLVHAKGMRRKGETLDGMICLESVGFCNPLPGSQRFPFPLMHLNYPSSGDFLALVSDGKSRALATSIQSAFQKNPGIPVHRLTVPARGWLTPFVRRSDHVSFWDMGYKAVLITDTADYRNPHYHQPSDTMEKLDYPFMARLVESLIRFFTSSGGR